MILKKIISNIVIVILVVFVLDFAVGNTLNYLFFKESSGLHFRTTYAMEKTKADILVFGSSRANHHYVPKVFEDSLKMSFYNTGRDGTGIFFQLAVLKSILKRYTPKIIILDYEGGFKKGTHAYDRMSSLLPYYKTHREIRNIIELKSPYERIKLLSKIYPFNSDILTIMMGNLEINKKRWNDNKGYLPLYKVWNAKIDSIKTFSTYEVDPNQIAAFNEFINMAKESGAKVFVVYSPIFLKGNRNQDINLCNEICSDENVHFWDYSKDTLFLNNNCFFQDVEHMNNNGALIFSESICYKLKHSIELE